MKKRFRVAMTTTFISILLLTGCTSKHRTYQIEKNIDAIAGATRSH